MTIRDTGGFLRPQGYRSGPKRQPANFLALHLSCEQSECWRKAVRPAHGHTDYPIDAQEAKGLPAVNTKMRISCSEADCAISSAGFGRKQAVSSICRSSG